MIVPVTRIADVAYAEFDFFAEPRSLRAYVTGLLRREAPGLSELEAVEALAGGLMQSYVSALVDKQQRSPADGAFCPFEVRPDSDEIVGFSYPRPDDDELMARVRRVAPEVPETLAKIRELTPTGFELFCKRLLDLMKAEDTIQTQASRDEGIDFVGWLCIPETFLHTGDMPQFRKDFRLLVIGQSKRYSVDRLIEVSHIRELVGTAAAFHHDQMAPWPSRLQVPSVTLMAPLLPLIVTTGRVSSGAKKLAKRCGVVARDGTEIAVFLCLEGPVMTTDLRPKFQPELFDAWLNGS